MLKFVVVVVLSFAAVAVSAITKSDILEKLNGDEFQRTLFAYHSAPTLLVNNMRNTVSALSQIYPSEAECLKEISVDPLEEILSNLTSLVQQEATKAKSIVSEVDEVSDSDETELEAINEEINEFVRDPVSVLSEALKPVADKLLADAKSKCNCEEQGWCSVFEM